MCRNSKLAANEVCSTNNDCELGSCGIESFDPTSNTVCCTSGELVRMYLSSSSSGWPTSGSCNYCRGQKLGTACGEIDSICQSDACVQQTCQATTLAANEECSIGNDCLMNVCGYESLSPKAKTVCCESGASTRVYLSSSDGWPSSGSRYFCTSQPTIMPVALMTNFACPMHVWGQLAKPTS